MVLESTKDRILGVDTPGQHVPPRVRYGMTYLLIKNTIGSVSCSVEWEMASYSVTHCVTYFVKCLTCTVQEGLLMGNP
jgi:hypothetical protein